MESSLFDVCCCHPLIYTPFGGLQSRGAELIRKARPRRRFCGGGASWCYYHNCFFCSMLC